MAEGAKFTHACAAGCGRWGAFGFDVGLLRGRKGRWYCAAHRPAAPDSETRAPPAAETVAPGEGARQGRLL